MGVKTETVLFACYTYMMHFVHVNYIDIIKSTSPLIKRYITLLINEWAQVKISYPTGKSPLQIESIH